MNNDIDPNKIITPIMDCQGTCKTPIGCTCGRKPNEDLDSHLIPKGVDVKSDLESQLCGCGKNPGGLCGCKTGGGCSSGGCSGCSSKPGGGCCSGSNKLEVYDWMENMSDMIDDEKMVEVQFKNTRKDYYLNSNDIELYKGDVVAVEASPGHDIGEITLTGKLVKLQMMKNNYRGETKRVYRIAKTTDIDKYEEAKKREHKTMLRAREIAEELNLGMKISDVEFQGDGNKSIFYYIADGRVDFRQLIKMYASEFRVKIEMKQIGARQEAGRVGGIGPCGRELCCSSSMSNFVSVSTSAARLQDIPLNPQKLAGQCGKLKCCLNFEVDTYVEAQRKLPSKEIILETKDSSYYHFKTDVLSGTMTYSTDKRFAANLVALHSTKVSDVIRMNKRGDRPMKLSDMSTDFVPEPSSHDILDQDIHRFDKEGKSGNKSRRKKSNRNGDAPRSENGNQPNGDRERGVRSEEGGRVRPSIKRKTVTPPNGVEAAQPSAATGAGGEAQARPNNRNNNRRPNNRNNNRRGKTPGNDTPNAGKTEA